MATQTFPPIPAATSATGPSRSLGTSNPDRLRAARSIQIARQDFAARGNLTFQDAAGIFKRDLNNALGYKIDLKYADYRARYERGGIAERIVEAYPKATWAGGATLVEDPSPDTETEFEKVAGDLFKRLNIWTKLLRADILARLGSYSVLLLGAKGELDKPLPDLSGPEDLLYVTPLPGSKATIDSEGFDKDPSSERFGLPLIYSLELGLSSTKRVHWSRIIHIAEGLLDNDIYGKPSLRAVWNNLDDLIKLVGGGSEAAWKRMDPGMQLDLDPEVQLDADEEEKLVDEVEEYQHGLSRTMRTRGVKLNMLSAEVAAFSQNVTALFELISGTSTIPQRILLGSERGQLASGQDRNNWNDRVDERKREFAEPVIFQLTDRLISKGILPEPESYTVSWKVPSDELDEAAKSLVVNNLANANMRQVTSGAEIIITSSEIRDLVLGLEPLDESQLPDIPPPTSSPALPDDTKIEEPTS